MNISSVNNNLTTVDNKLTNLVKDVESSTVMTASEQPYTLTRMTSTIVTAFSWLPSGASQYGLLIKFGGTSSYQGFMYFDVGATIKRVHHGYIDKNVSNNIVWTD